MRDASNSIRKSLPPFVIRAPLIELRPLSYVADVVVVTKGYLARNSFLHTPWDAAYHVLRDMSIENCQKRKFKGMNMIVAKTLTTHTTATG